MSKFIMSDAEMSGEGHSEEDFDEDEGDNSLNDFIDNGDEELPDEDERASRAAVDRRMDEEEEEEDRAYIAHLERRQEEEDKKEAAAVEKRKRKEARRSARKEAAKERKRKESQKKKKKKKKSKAMSSSAGPSSSSSIRVAAPVLAANGSIFPDREDMDDDEEEEEEFQDYESDFDESLIRLLETGLHLAEEEEEEEENLTIKQLDLEASEIGGQGTVGPPMEALSMRTEAMLNVPRTSPVSSLQSLKELEDAGGFNYKSNGLFVMAGSVASPYSPVHEHDSDIVRKAADDYSEARAEGTTMQALIAANNHTSLKCWLSGVVDPFTDDLVKLEKVLSFGAKTSLGLQRNLGLFSVDDLEQLPITGDVGEEDSSYDLKPSWENQMLAKLRKSFPDPAVDTAALLRDFHAQFNACDTRMMRFFKQAFFYMHQKLLQLCSGLNIIKTDADLEKLICSALNSRSGAHNVETLHLEREEAAKIGSRLANQLNCIKMLITVCRRTYAELDRMRNDLHERLHNPAFDEAANKEAKMELGLFRKTVKADRLLIGSVRLPIGGEVRAASKSTPSLELIWRYLDDLKGRVSGEKVMSTLHITSDVIGNVGSGRASAVNLEPLEAIPEDLDSSSDKIKRERKEARHLRREICDTEGVFVFDTNVEREVGCLQEIITRAMLKQAALATLMPGEALDPEKLDVATLDVKSLKTALASLPSTIQALHGVIYSKFDAPDRHRRAFMDGMLDITLDFDLPYPLPTTPMVIPFRDPASWEAYLDKKNAAPTLKYFHYSLAGNARNTDSRYLGSDSDHDYPIAMHYRTLVTRQPGDPLAHCTNFATDGMAMYRAGPKVGPQMAKLLVGNSKTGKSTHVDMVVYTYPSAYEASIGGAEGVFGAQKFTQHTMLAHAQEMGPAMGCSSTFMQSAIGWDKVTIAVKHGEPREFIWQIFILMAGNMVGPWLDTAGSMMRRLMIFLYVMRFVLESATINADTRADIGPTILFMVRLFIQLKASRFVYLADLNQDNASAEDRKVDAKDQKGQSRLAQTVDRLRYAQSSSFGPSYFEAPSTQYFSRTRLAYASHTSKLAQIIEENAHEVIFVEGFEPTKISVLVDYFNRKAKQGPAGADRHQRQRAQYHFDPDSIKNLARQYNLEEIGDALSGIVLCENGEGVEFIRFCAIAMLGKLPELIEWVPTRFSGAGRAADAAAPPAGGGLDSDAEDEEDEEERKEGAAAAPPSPTFRIHLPDFDDLPPNEPFVGRTEPEFKHVISVLAATETAILRRLEATGAPDVTKQQRALWNYREWYPEKFTERQRRYADAITEEMKEHLAPSEEINQLLRMFTLSGVVKHKYPRIVREKDFKDALDRWMAMEAPVEGFEIKDKAQARTSHFHPPPEHLEWTPINKLCYPTPCSSIIINDVSVSEFQ